MIYNIKGKCGTYWGTPSIEDDKGNYYHRITQVDFELMGRIISAKLVPVGEMSCMGHGCGSGYSASGLLIEDHIVIPDDFINMRVYGEKI